MGHTNYTGGDELDHKTLYILLLTPTIFFALVVMAVLYNAK
jgi:hypothetical protein